jgi:TolB protein
MTELKNALEQLRDEVRPPPGSFDRLIVRRGRLRRNQRLAASILALVVAVAGVGLAIRALGTTRGPRPAAPALVGSIAFSRGAPTSGIYVINPDGSDLLRLTSDPGDDQAAWSPDGSEIAFVRSRQGNEDIYVMRSDGTGIRRLTMDGASGSAWSPDGTRIAFARETPGNADIYVMERDGTHVMRLTRDPLLEYTPAWSPDGSKIAFVGQSKGTPSTPARYSQIHLYVMNADGSGAQRVGPEGAAIPRWSPDSEQIMFVNEWSGSIYTIRPDGTGLRRIVDLASLPGGTNFKPNFTSPAWSPDGAKIVFAAGDSTSSHLYLVNADGSSLVQLTSGLVSDESPAWSSS